MAEGKLQSRKCGNDVVPVENTPLIIAPAETYDLVVTIAENMILRIQSNCKDRTGYSSLWFGAWS